MSQTPRRTLGGGGVRGQDRGQDRGWCPRHDQVYTSRDGTCPDCGTALVALEQAARPADQDAAAAASPVETAAGSGTTPAPEIQVTTGAPAVDALHRSPRAARAVVGAAVIGAFALGLLFPRTQSDEPAGPTPLDVSQDVRVGSVARAGAGALRLERFTQEGRAFVAIVSAHPDPRLVVGAAVEMTTEGSLDEQDEFGVSDVRLTPRPRGFTIRGGLPAGAGRVIGFRLSSIQLRVPEKPAWTVDISRVWPVRGIEPGVVHVGSHRRAGDGGALRLVSILAWHDRMEADFELIRSSDGGNVSVDGLELETLHDTDSLQEDPRITLAAVQQEQISPSEIVARFAGVPAGARRITIRAGRLSRFLTGPWRWSIA